MTRLTLMKITAEALKGVVYLAALCLIVFGLPLLPLLNTDEAYIAVMPLAFGLLGVATVSAVTLQNGSGDWFISGVTIDALGKISIFAGILMLPYWVHGLHSIQNVYLNTTLSMYCIVLLAYPLAFVYRSPQFTKTTKSVALLALNILPLMTFAIIAVVTLLSLR
ncbi:hypothetical protein JSO19_12355 [Leucobacter sp. UCMA 4100]|uniref:hypothetical protein n=1 Tax=Leucobacter sp. UCMA 4100 TaxID=2810534 RepID=UPI0022EAADE7|nr:hypothetical protein [Leucobacter sp. UCMA 4100]MDA3148164.1 hypothetical protein [Leucobacter sp. UCMA 4100]